MQVDENGQVTFKVYEAAAENNTDQKNPALRRMVSLPSNLLIASSDVQGAPSYFV